MESPGSDKKCPWQKACEHDLLNLQSRTKYESTYACQVPVFASSMAHSRARFEAVDAAGQGKSLRVDDPLNHVLPAVLDR